MEKTNFEKLRIYQLAEQLSDKVWKCVNLWSVFAQDTLGKQLVRSVDSIGSNIAEGSGRGTSLDFCRFLKIARGSLYETRHWLRRAYKRRLLTEVESQELLPIIEELTPKLNAYLRSVRETEFRRKTVARKNEQRPKTKDRRVEILNISADR